MLALRAGTLPTLLCWLGFTVAALSAVAVAGYMSLTAKRSYAPTLVAVGVGAGTLMSAAWFAWLGIELLT